MKHRPFHFTPRILSGREPVPPVSAAACSKDVPRHDPLLPRSCGFTLPSKPVGVQKTQGTYFINWFFQLPSTHMSKVPFSEAAEPSK